MSDASVRCLLCNKIMKMVTNTHLMAKHGVSCKEYKRQFPGESLGQTDWFDEWRHSEENAINSRRQLELIQHDVELQSRRKRNVAAAWSDPRLLKKQSETMKLVAQTNENSIESFKSAKLRVTPWMKLSNYEKWSRKFGKEEADRRQLEWQAKNVLPKTSRDTKPELKIEKLLNELEVKLVKQHPVVKYYCDFFLPERNLVIEHFGDYHHANPFSFFHDDLVTKKKLTAQELWVADFARLVKIKEQGFDVLVIWERCTKRLTSIELSHYIDEAKKTGVYVVNDDLAN